jgi:hypothetical protein
MMPGFLQIPPVVVILLAFQQRMSTLLSSQQLLSFPRKRGSRESPGILDPRFRGDDRGNESGDDKGNKSRDDREALSRGASRVVALVTVLLVTVFLVSVLPAAAFAAASVGLELDRGEATLQDTVTLKVKVGGSTSTDSSPQIQGLKDFSVVAGGTSTSIEIINFSRTERVEFLYYLQPKATGTFRIGPAVVRDGGKVYQSNTVSLTVRDVASSQGSQGGQAVQAEGPLFLKAELTKSTAYADEPVIYSLRLYRTVKVSNVALDIPDNPALSFKKIGEPLEYTTNVDGQAYQVLEVRYEVTASAKGRYKFPPASMDMTVYQSSRSNRRFPFNDPFFSFSAPAPKTVRSNPVELNVQPLPAQGRPAGFSSLVGQYTMDAHLDKEGIAAGETATLTVTVQGRGNVSRIPDLTMPEIPGIRIYPDQPALLTNMDASGYKAVKTMKWAFVPQKEGVYEIPTLGLSYFDTAAKAYRVLQTPRQTLKVRPGTPGQAVPAQPVPAVAPRRSPGSGVEEVGRDILPVHTGAQSFTGGFEAMPKPALLWLLVLGPPLVFLGGLLVKRGMNPSRKRDGGVKARGALKAFLKACSPGRSTSEDLLGAVRGYFNSSFGSSLGTLTPGEAGEILERAGVDKAVRSRLTSLLEELTGRVFTGRGKDVFERADELASLMRDIDRQGR